MDTIAKIIYDKLASGGGIHLPDVGWLYVERDAARFISGRELRPPHNRVVFSRRQNPLLESVVDILRRADGMNAAAAEKQYAAWLATSRGERGFVEINGVGVIKNNFFYPSVELHDRLNPLGNKNMVLKRGNRGARFLLIAGVVCAVAALALFAVSLTRDPDRAKKRPERTATKENTVHPTPLDTAGKENIREVVAGERAAQRGQDPENAAAQSRLGKPARQQAGQNAPAATTAQAAADKPVQTTARTAQATQPQGVVTYHVVVGIFDSQRNADKCVREDPVKIGSANYKIYPYSRNRLMVSAYESKSKADTEARQRELKKHKPDAWVYTRKQ